ncbi:MAG TPA: hypothetical protein VMY37_27860 [Thermoguttaceae bacterium]|nr:hypothetical protein [Thermoguttaceae bacterium]
MPVYYPASREYQFVPGAGGNLAVTQYDANGAPQESPVLLDVGQYVLELIFKNKPTPHSGLRGGPGLTRVGCDWNFAAQVSFPAHRIGIGVENEELAAPYIETILGSSRGVAICFQIGDPVFWTSRNFEPRSYRGRSMLGKVQVTNDASGDDVVRLNVIGGGTSMLWTYLGEAAHHPLIWF